MTHGFDYLKGTTGNIKVNMLREPRVPRVAAKKAVDSPITMVKVAGIDRRSLHKLKPFPPFDRSIDSQYIWRGSRFQLNWKGH